MKTTPTTTPSAAPASPTRPIAPDTARRLRRDQRLLLLMLGRVLDRFAAPGLRQELTATADLARARRAGIAAAGTKLRERLANAGVEELDQLARAAACFFDVSNLAEERQRVRVLVDAVGRRGAAPYPDSVGDAWSRVAKLGLDADTATDLWQRLHIEPVLTAHPTESKRRAVRQSLGRLRSDLGILETEQRPIQRRERLDRVRSDLGCLWQTDPFRDRKPTVAEEVGRSLSYFDTMWTAVPRLSRAARAGYTAAYGPTDTKAGGTKDDNAPLRSPVTVGSWIGGDRDGNPFVTARVTAQTLTRLRSSAIVRHLDSCEKLTAVLTISSRRQPAPAALLRALDHAAAQWPEALGGSAGADSVEVYRAWLKVIRYRLKQSDRVTPSGARDGSARIDGAYPDAKAFEADVQLIADALRESGHVELADGPVQDWLDRITTFGLHLARLDIREHAGRLQRVIDELSRALGAPAPPLDTDPDGRRDYLLKPVGPGAGELTGAPLSEESVETLAVFSLLEDVGRSFGPDALGARIVSMTSCAADVLAPLWLARVAAAATGRRETAAPWPVVPLFETIDDLKNSSVVLDELLSLPEYAAHVAGGRQRTAVHGRLQRQRQRRRLPFGLLGPVPRPAGLGRDRRRPRRVAHHLPRPRRLAGARRRPRRPGHPRPARQRGGRPPARHRAGRGAQRALRRTQDRPASPRTDHRRHLPGHRRRRSGAFDDDWVDLIQKASQASRDAYRELIEADGYLTYFAHATPIEQIERLPIGSRPSRRGGSRELTNLRAIPYTFAWTQARCPITAFYGLGAASPTRRPIKAGSTPSAPCTKTGRGSTRSSTTPSWPWSKPTSTPSTGTPTWSPTPTPAAASPAC